jgi:hypothetical protein
VLTPLDPPYESVPNSVAVTVPAGQSSRKSRLKW